MLQIIHQHVVKRFEDSVCMTYTLLVSLSRSLQSRKRGNVRLYFADDVDKGQLVTYSEKHRPVQYGSSYCNH
jgi:hypothetical protein